MMTSRPDMTCTVEDPIFAAIERHRSAMDALDKVDAEHAGWADLDTAEKAAWADFVQSVPRTRNGLLAYVSYAASYPDLAQAGTPLDLLQTIETSLSKLS